MAVMAGRCPGRVAIMTRPFGWRQAGVRLQVARRRRSHKLPLMFFAAMSMYWFEATVFRCADLNSTCWAT